jgi:hypothetical protein
MKEYTQDTTTNDANNSSALAVATKAREKNDSSKTIPNHHISCDTDHYEMTFFGFHSCSGFFCFFSHLLGLLHSSSQGHPEEDKYDP